MKNVAKKCVGCMKLEKKSNIGWAKYYAEVDENFVRLIGFYDLISSFHNYMEENLSNKMPPHIVSEMNELHSLLKKSVECPICLDVLDDFVISSCGHKYCKECLDKLIDTTNTCAICRKTLKWKKP